MKNERRAIGKKNQHTHIHARAPTPRFGHRLLKSKHKTHLRVEKEKWPFWFQPICGIWVNWHVCKSNSKQTFMSMYSSSVSIVESFCCCFCFCACDLLICSATIKWKTRTVLGMMTNLQQMTNTYNSKCVSGVFLLACIQLIVPYSAV